MGASDALRFRHGSIETLRLKSTESVFNELSSDIDFRVESNDNTHMLFVDGGNNRVGIGKAPATHPFEIGVYAQFDTGMTINETGVDADFRVESQSKTHALFVDGGTNAVGINSSAPGASQTFADTSVAPNFHVDSDGFSNGPLFTYNNTGVFLGMANDVGSGTRYYITFGDSSSARYGDITSNGSVMTYGGTSDHRLKTNVQAMSGSIDRVKNLNPVTFDWISSGINAEGFIAHEVQSVVPDAATGTHNEVDSNGKPVYQQIDPRHIVPLLTGALKEAITKIETLEARIAALES